MEYSNDVIIFTLLLIILVIIIVINLINNTNIIHETLGITTATVALAAPAYKAFGGNESLINNKSKIKPIPDKFPEKYDEYDDMSLLKKPLENKYDYVVLDGANIIHFIMNEMNEMNNKKIKYFDALKRLISMSELFKGQNVIIVLKHQNKIIKKLPPNITLVIGEGKHKALDDNTCIFITEAINLNKKESAILISRDRYRDIANISGSKPSNIKIYGNKIEYISKLFDNFKDKFTTIGTWSYKDALVGYTYNTEKLSDIFWERIPKNIAASPKIYLFKK
jgi:hypothetical protein